MKGRVFLVDLKHILINYEVTSYFNEFGLNNILKQLNVILDKTTHFNETEFVSVFGTVEQGFPCSIKLLCIGLESKQQVVIILRHGIVVNKQPYKLTNPLLEVDEQGLDTTRQYILETDGSNIEIHQFLAKDKNTEPGYRYINN